MMYRLWRYDDFRFARNDVARFTRNDAMFAPMCPQAHFIRRSRHHWRSQHHLRDRQTSFKKRTFVTRQKCVFNCLKATKRCVKWGKNDQKYTTKGFYMALFCSLFFLLERYARKSPKEKAKQTKNPIGIIISPSIPCLEYIWLY